MVAIANSALPRVVQQDGTIRSSESVKPGTPVVGEAAFKRMLGLLPARSHPATLSFSADDIRSVSALTSDQLACLVISDLLAGAGDSFAFSDLVTARRISRSLGDGVPFREALRAEIQMERFGVSGSVVNLQAAPWGELMGQNARRSSHLNGQYALPLKHRSREAQALVATARQANRGSRPHIAERFARAAILSFPEETSAYDELAWALVAQTRFNEALAAWHKAVTIDPTFVEGWCELAEWAEQVTEDSKLAVHYFERALEVDPESDRALSMLPLSLSNAGRKAEAVVALERELAREGSGARMPARGTQRFKFVCEVELLANAETAWTLDERLFGDAR